MTLSDYRRAESDGIGVVYHSQVASASEYYPFGQLLTDGNYSSGSYRFGFNGMEKDDEIKGTGNSYDFGARLYDPRIGRWMSVDPLASKMPWNSPYVYANNNPIYYIDADGKIPWPVKKWRGAGWNTRYGWFGQERHYYPPGKTHGGVDINSDLGVENDLGAPVYATHSGKVIKLTHYNEDDNSGGTRITIQSANGVVRTVYMHLNSVTVKEGQMVYEGQQIGTVGGSGEGERYKHPIHLHYEIHLRQEDGNYEPIDPEGGQRNSGHLIDPQQFCEGARYSLYSMMVNPPTSKFLYDPAIFTLLYGHNKASSTSIQIETAPELESGALTEQVDQGLKEFENSPVSQTSLRFIPSLGTQQIKTDNITEP